MKSIKHLILITALLGATGFVSHMYAMKREGLDEPEEERKESVETWEMRSRRIDANTLLLKETEADDLIGVQKALSLNADANTTGSYGNTPLHLDKSGAVVAALANAGAALETQNLANQTPLQYACFLAQTEAKEYILGVVDTLLAWGANPEVRDQSTGKTILQGFIQSAEDKAYDGALDQYYYENIFQPLVSKLIRAGAQKPAPNPIDMNRIRDKDSNTKKQILKTLNNIRTFVALGFETEQKEKTRAQIWPKSKKRPLFYETMQEKLPRDIIDIADKYIPLPEDEEEVGASAAVQR